MVALLVTLLTAGQLVQTGRAARSGDLEIWAGSLVFRPTEASVLFGGMRGASEAQVSYLLVLKGQGQTAALPRSSAEARVEGLAGQARHTLQLEGQSLQLEYTVKLDPVRKTINRETLSLNGKVVDLLRGRVFLIDWSVNPYRWQQRQTALPSGSLETASKKQTEALARRFLAELSKQDRVLKEFIERSGR
jgi:hypothetical protein